MTIASSDVKRSVSILVHTVNLPTYSTDSTVWLIRILIIILLLSHTHTHTQVLPFWMSVWERVKRPWPAVMWRGLCPSRL